MEVNPNFSDKAKADFELIQIALQHRSSAAYEKLLERYKKTVFFLVLKIVQNSDDAEDVTIETFGKVFNKLESYNPEYAFSTWLYKVATNIAIDTLRRNKIETLSIHNHIGDDEDKDHSHNIRSTTPDPEEEFIKKQRADTVRATLEKLSDHYRLLIQKRYFEELSYDEIAEEMNIPISTVKTHLYRAKDLLYAILKNNATKI